MLLYDARGFPPLLIITFGHIFVLLLLLRGEIERVFALHRVCRAIAECCLTGHGRRAAMRTRECVADSLVCEGHDSYGRRCADLFSACQIQHDGHPQFTSFTSLDISSTLLSAPEFGIQARVVVACFNLDVMDIRVHNRGFLLAQQSVSFWTRAGFNSDTEPIVCYTLMR